MLLSKYLKYASIGAIGIIVVGEIYHYCAVKLKENLKLDYGEEQLTEIVFTRQLDYNSPLTRKITFQREPVQHATEVLENLILRSAKKSIWVAMYIFTSEPLSQALSHVKSRGIEVKVIIDKSMEHSSGSKIAQMQYAGIEVKIRDVNTLHLKLCLIDVPHDAILSTQASSKSSFRFSIIRIPKSGLIITGSLNWTREALLSNEENFIVTTNKSICNSSAGVFNELWKTSRTYNG